MVSVERADGEHLPLLTPPGVRNVQRVLASIPAVDDTADPDEVPKASRLLLDIVPLGPTVNPHTAIAVDGVSLILPSYAAPMTSLVIALEDTSGAAGW